MVTPYLFKGYGICLKKMATASVSKKKWPRHLNIPKLVQAQYAKQKEKHRRSEPTRRARESKPMDDEREKRARTSPTDPDALTSTNRASCWSASNRTIAPPSSDRADPLLASRGGGEAMARARERERESGR
jgi:hypothetical protein